MFAWIKTYGCQMNVHDSERILTHVTDAGYEITDNQNQADLIVFNSCSVREKAAQKLYSALGEIRLIKKNNPKLLVAVGGCLAVTDGKELLSKNPHVNFVFGTDTIDQLPELLFRAKNGESKILANRLDRKNSYSTDTKVFWQKPQAFVNIQKGCDKFCTFCVVPFTRGREKSRSIQEVFDDVKDLVSNKGVKEITLLGQTVNSYGKKNGETFSELLIKISPIEGLELIRYTSPHPSDMSDDLIECHKTLHNLARHVHLPLQCGSNRILELMRRDYSVEQYLEIVQKFRASVPDISITTDIIVGFPGETEEEFEETLSVMRSVEYDSVYSFVYSTRPGTKAESMLDPVEEKVKKSWLRKLQSQQLEIQENKNKNRVGKKYRVFVEGKSKKEDLYLTGRTSGNQVVNFQSPRQEIINHFVDLKISSATALSLKGELI